MNNLNQIKSKLNNDLIYFESLLESQIRTEDDLLKAKIEYLFSSKGKRIRPFLVYLISRMFKEPTEKTHTAALIIEILHTATLVHDDVVDNSDLRRGMLTSNKKWDNKTAVLLGDYLFAKCMHLIYKNSAHDLFDIISPVLIDLSYGELQQLRYNNKAVCNKKDYFEIINKKTASLIAACCVAGANSVGINGEDLVNINKLGLIIGQIYQIRDDILDFDKTQNTGKNSGNDIIERKMTLPLIFALEKSAESEKNQIISLWTNKEPEDEDVIIIKDFVKKHKGIDYASKTMNLLKEEALSLIKSYDNNSYKNDLKVFIKYITNKQLL